MTFSHYLCRSIIFVPFTPAYGKLTETSDTLRQVKKPASPLAFFIFSQMIISEYKHDLR